MDFYDIVSSRRTVRDFTGREVPPEILRRILGAGLMAPSNDHLRNWEFVVIRDSDAIGRILQRVPGAADRQMKALQDRILTERQQRMYFDAVPKQYRMLSGSGCLILLFFKQNGDLLKPHNLSSLNAFASAWCCIENILLAATAEGLACAIRIPSGDEAQHVSEAVRAPKDYVMPCYISIGYPSADAVRSEQERINVDDRIHLEGW